MNAIFSEGGDYAITTNSFLVCQHGGVIMVVTSGQESVMDEDIANDEVRMSTGEEVSIHKASAKTTSVGGGNELGDGAKTSVLVGAIIAIKAEEEKYVTSEQLEAIGFKNVDIKDLNRVLEKYDITTTERIRHFLAQCYHESKTGLRELWGDSKGTWESREDYFSNRDFNDLNNIKGNEAKKGDGAKYSGAGYIQLTWKVTYNDFAKYVGDSKIIDEGSKYVAENYAWEAAGWFWSVNKEINQTIDNETTVLEVTRKVNGGENGLNDRETAYKTACEVIK